ncbi:MAG: hypothetical protein ABI612_14880 [Betaproteobacteria bacterium]
MSLVLIAVASLYLLISTAIVGGAVAFARRRGRSPNRWGWGAALGMYLLVFWDYIPTVVVHKYYCETRAGSWVYKTVDQWSLENPGVLETLVSNKGHVRKSEGDANNYVQTAWLNQRFIFIGKHHGPFFLNRWQLEKQIVDGKTGELIAQEIDFSTSQERREPGWAGWKFWLNAKKCSSYSHIDRNSVSAIAKAIEGTRE